MTIITAKYDHMSLLYCLMAAVPTSATTSGKENTH